MRHNENENIPTGTESHEAERNPEPTELEAVVTENTPAPYLSPAETISQTLSQMESMYRASSTGVFNTSKRRKNQSDAARVETTPIVRAQVSHSSQTDSAAIESMSCNTGAGGLLVDSNTGGAGGLLVDSNAADTQESPKPLSWRRLSQSTPDLHTPTRVPLTTDVDNSCELENRDASVSVGSSGGEFESLEKGKDAHTGSDDNVENSANVSENMPNNQ